MRGAWKRVPSAIAPNARIPLSLRSQSGFHSLSFRREGHSEDRRRAAQKDVPRRRSTFPEIPFRGHLVSRKSRCERERTTKDKDALLRSGCTSEAMAVSLEIVVIYRSSPSHGCSSCVIVTNKFKPRKNLILRTRTDDSLAES